MNILTFGYKDDRLGQSSDCSLRQLRSITCPMDDVNFIKENISKNSIAFFSPQSSTVFKCLVALSLSLLIVIAAGVVYASGFYYAGVTIGCLALCIVFVCLAILFLKFFGSTFSSQTQSFVNKNQKMPQPLVKYIKRKFSSSLAKAIYKYTLSIRDVRSLIDFIDKNKGLNHKLRRVKQLMKANEWAILINEIENRLSEHQYSLMGLNYLLLEQCPRYWCECFMHASHYSEDGLKAFIGGEVFNQQTLFDWDFIKILKSMSEDDLTALQEMISKCKLDLGHKKHTLSFHELQLLIDDNSNQYLTELKLFLVNLKVDDNSFDDLLKKTLILVTCYSSEQMLLLRSLSFDAVLWLQVMTFDNGMSGLALYTAMISLNEDDDQGYDDTLAMMTWSESIEGFKTRLNILLEEIGDMTLLKGISECYESHNKVFENRLDVQITISQIQQEEVLDIEKIYKLVPKQIKISNILYSDLFRKTTKNICLVSKLKQYAELKIIFNDLEIESLLGKDFSYITTSGFDDPSLEEYTDYLKLINN